MNLANKKRKISYNNTHTHTHTHTTHVYNLPSFVSVVRSVGGGVWSPGVGEPARGLGRGWNGLAPGLRARHPVCSVGSSRAALSSLQRLAPASRPTVQQTAVNIYTYTQKHIYTYTHIHIYTYTHIHIYTYTHIHIYTYTHHCDVVDQSQCITACLL